jgi:hypothetical protein
VTFHHPPYSRGSHNSDNTSSDYELVQMRENIVPILEQFNVDLVLSGHSHSYERSYLIRGHHGFSPTFAESHKQDPGPGHSGAGASYNKATGASTGAVFAVPGSAGQTSGGCLNHPAMFVSLNKLGSVVLDVSAGRLDYRFLRENGAVEDHFTILKGGATPPSIDLSVASTAASTTATAIVSAGVTSVKFYRDGTLVATDTAAPFAATISGLAAGSTYIIWAEAFTATDKSLSSPVTIVKNPPVPAALTGLVATGTGAGEVSLSWTDTSAAGAQSEDGVVIERSIGGGAFAEVGRLLTNRSPSSGTGSGNTWLTESQFVDVGLMPGTTARYRVRAFNAEGASAWVESADVVVPSGAANRLVALKSKWRYHDQGIDLGTAWRQPGYSDESWAEGQAQLGYGDGDEETTVAQGPSGQCGAAKNPTTYFRRAFTVAGSLPPTELNLRILRDDGAIVYLNGREVYRSNMALGSIAGTTYTGNAIDDVWDLVTIDYPPLVSGVNVLAVEMHQADSGSSDISFDLELSAVVDTGALRVPTGLTATASSPYQVRLDWQDNSTSESGHHVEKLTGGAFQPIATLGPNLIQAFDNGLASTSTHRYRVRNRRSGVYTCSQEVEATTCGVTITPSVATLWPPNGKMETVTLAQANGCNAPLTCSVVSVTSSEPCADCTNFTGGMAVSLRAARLGSGAARVYTIEVECADSAGSKGRHTTTVTVPHDQGNG